MSPNQPRWFLAGDRVQVIGGTFVGLEGTVIDPVQVGALLRQGDQTPEPEVPDRFWVLLPLFDRQVPVLLDRFQLQAIE
jgi:hypothetical protein